MLWNHKQTFELEPFDAESELEAAIVQASGTIFGKSRIYLDIKRKIGEKGKTRNIPDGYLIDLSSKKQPKLYIVEVELAKHEPLKHIAVQILEFSLSFETSSHLVKNTVKNAILANDVAAKYCQDYAVANGFENIDVLLEKMIYPQDSFNAMVIIDEMPDELEVVLQRRFKFPVEIVTFERFINENRERIYRFDPFLEDVVGEIHAVGANGESNRIDISDIDTIVVPAKEDGFKEVFLGENRWYAIRIHSSMLSRIKHIAVYQVHPESAITHIATVKSIKQWKDTNKYVLNFTGHATPIEPIRLVSKGKVKPLYNSRYTSKSRLEKATNLDEAF
jgi:hypothetical protein